MANSWTKLPLSSNSELFPNLYVKIDLKAAKSTVFLSDLTNIWSEILDHRQLLRRASDIGTSIDPSEDKEQLDVLLQKIIDALTGEEYTTVSISSGTWNDELVLETSTRLPSPFQPLHWHFKLAFIPPPYFTEQFLLPVLEDHARLLDDLKGLLQHLEEKDHALNRLLDKAESSGVSLNEVFPALRGGKRATSRTAAESHVPGLAVFNRKKWRWQSEEGRMISDQSKVDGGLLETLFNVSSRETKSASIEAVQGRWWTKLSELNTPTIRKQNEDAITRRLSRKETTQQSEDEFQTQEVHTSLKEAGEAFRSTDRPNEDDAHPLSASRAHPAPAKRKLGKIGGSEIQAKRTKTVSPDPHKPETLPLRESTPLRLDVSDDTASETDPDSASSATPSSKPHKAKDSSTSAPMRRVGVIGGRQKQTSPEPTAKSSPTVEATPKELSSPRTRPKHKLGAIGGKEKTIPSKELSPTSSRSRTPEKEAPAREAETPEKDRMHGSGRGPKDRSPVVDETEEEKANRRRRELHEKLKAKEVKPVKKKRKF